MQRNLTALENRRYDVLVVGGGACGAFAALEAARRGLSVALIERRDFCGATSANSLKVIHGGLRYLQQADVGRVLASAHTRRRLMRVAPHLVQPLPCVLPTENRFMRSRLVMSAGLLANDLLAFNRNRGADGAHRVHLHAVDYREKILAPQSADVFLRPGDIPSSRRIAVEKIIK